jgi:hypothetical protein
VVGSAPALRISHAPAIASTGRLVLQQPTAVGEKRWIMAHTLNPSARHRQPVVRSLSVGLAGRAAYHLPRHRN